MDFTPQQDAMRRDLGKMQQVLASAKDHSVVRGTSSTCPNPAHDDRNPSGHIKVGPDGFVRFSCLSCGFHGDVFDVMAACENTTAAEILQRYNERDSGRQEKAERTFDSYESLLNSIRGVSNVYRYSDFVVFRQQWDDGKKKFLQAHRCQDGKWVFGLPRSNNLPLFLLDRLRKEQKSTPVVVCEGEKAVDALIDLNITATTSSGGSNKAKFTDWRPLAGKTVLIWPDNDVPGAKYADDVIAILSKLVPKPKLMRIDPETLDLEPGGDAWDYVEEVKRVGLEVEKAVAAVIAKARPVSASSRLKDRLDDIQSGKWTDIPFPWPLLSKLGRGLLPHNVCVLCGQSGGAKSFYTMYALLHWLDKGVNFAYLDLEEDLTYNLHRALAMLSGVGDVLDPDWVKGHPDEWEQEYLTHQDTLDRLAPHIHEPPAEDITTDWVCQWSLNQAKRGVRLLIIDPITVAAPSNKPWIDDHKFVTHTKRLLRDHDASILLITHPKKGSQGFGLDDLAGGAAYQRLAHAIFWLQWHGAGGAVCSVESPLGLTDMTLQHTIHICKSRKGRGVGMRIGYTVDWSDMAFTERGIIQDK